MSVTAWTFVAGLGTGLAVAWVIGFYREWREWKRWRNGR